MLSAADNERLTRVGADSPMGKALRRYWIPVCCSSELAERDGAPVRVRLLGENFVAFRDSEGRVGILNELCPHRGGSLVYGRNEDGGLRCLWHGWKFGADGCLLAAPNMPAGRYKEEFKADAYPVEEGGGLVWVYLGPPEHRPARPIYSWELLPEENRSIIPIELDCNWVQTIENLVDSSHASVLHTDLATFEADTNPLLGVAKALTANALPELEVERTDFGLHYAAIRSDGEERQVRVTSYAAPLMCFIPNGGQAFIGVPIDDTHSRFYTLNWDPENAIGSGEGLDHLLTSLGLQEDTLRSRGLQPTMPPSGEIPPRNTFPQDRAAMASKASWSGLGGLTAEDAAMVTSSPICDRSQEHLVPADRAVVLMRRVLLDCAGNVEQGRPPVGINATTPSEKIAAEAAVITATENWRSLVPQHVTYTDTPK